MTNKLAYKPNVTEVLADLRLLYERRAGDRIFAAMQVPSLALAEFLERFPEASCDYPDTAVRIEFWDKLLGERAVVEDHAMPSAYLSEFDQGLYGGLLGGDVRFMTHPESGWISSMVAPLLDDWSRFDSLRFDPAHPWFERYLAQTKAFVEAAADKFGVSHFIMIDGLNFVFELVGATETYMSVEDRPEIVRRAIDFAFDLNVQIQTTFFELVPAFEEGTSSNMAQWVPGKIVSESVDPFHMTSVDYFERWGREPIERILGRFDGGVVHIHGNGRHLLEAVSTLPGLKAISLLDDRGFPRAVDILDELQTRTTDTPLVVNVDFDVFAEKLQRHQLRGGVFYKVKGVPSVDAANRCMEKVRAYRM